MKPLDDLLNSRSMKGIDELEKLAGFSPSKKNDDKFSDIAGKVSKKKEPKKTPEDDRNWNIHKVFAKNFDEHGRPFVLFIGDLLDIILSKPAQAKLVSEMIDEKISRLRKARAAASESTKKKLRVAAKPSSKYDMTIGDQKRLFSNHYLKRKAFLGALFLDSVEYQEFLKLLKQINTICSKEAEAPAGDEKERKEALSKIIAELRYETRRSDVIQAWALLCADDFKHLEWFFNETKSLSLVRPDYYTDLDKAYRDGKAMLKNLLVDVQREFPPVPEKQETYEDYLKDIIEIYTHHHFVLKRYHQTRPAVSLKDFELTKEDLKEKITELRDETEERRLKINELTSERDHALSEIRTLNNKCAELEKKLRKMDPAEVKKQLKSAEAEINAAKKELHETLEEDAELRTDMRKLDGENQELIKRLQQANALPDEEAYSIAGLMEGLHVVIFGGIGRDHYWATLKEAGVKNEDYEWYEGYHTISLARTAEIVGRCDLAVVVTSYAGHLLLYQVRPCIQPHQKFFKIHNSGAGSLRKEILAAYKKKA